MNKKEQKIKIEKEIEDIILLDFNSDIINKKPKTEKELYEYYSKYTDIMIQYLRLKVSKVLRPLSNEMRALLGHLTDLNTENKIDRRELEKAYGHFRRLTLDSFKILCDEYDNVLYDKLIHQYHYNLNSVNIDYLENYSNLYVSAKKAYLEAQQAEKTGSDSTGDANVIKMYYEACKQYIELKRLYCLHKSKIKCVKIKASMYVAFTIISFVFSTTVSILTATLS